jgi:type II secretory pathway pseudopilin PulG
MTHKISRISNRGHERGSALIYILIAIALLAALTIAFMSSSGQQTQSQNSFKVVSEIQSQVEFIRSSVQECVLSHPGGDINIDNSNAGTDYGADRQYPIKPNSTYFTGSTIPPTSGRLVHDLRCPGNPGDNKDEVQIFGGTSGKFLPPAPGMFNDWQWYNGIDGVFFWTTTNATDSFVQSALTKLAAAYGTCESDTINATGGAVPLDSNAEVECPAGDYCFRIWMRANMATAVFPDNSANCHS